MGRTSRRPELLVHLERGSRQPLRHQIEQALREAIRTGRIPPGHAVPSTRTFATDLGISRGVLVEAYDQLVAEGYLVSAPGAATRVSDAVRLPPPQVPEPEVAPVDFDFRPGEPDLRAFRRVAGAWHGCCGPDLHAAGPATPSGSGPFPRPAHPLV